MREERITAQSTSLFPMKSNEKVRLLQELGAVLLDLSIADDQVRSAVFERVPQPLLEAAVHDCGRLIRPHPDR
jgi:hypothetical protein